MRTNVWPLLVGVAVLGSAGAVDAADVAVPVEKKVVVLTDTQMDEITAGHVWTAPVPVGRGGVGYTIPHVGNFWQSTPVTFFPVYIWHGQHTGCGAISCWEGRAY